MIYWQMHYKDNGKMERGLQKQQPSLISDIARICHEGHHEISSFLNSLSRGWRRMFSLTHLIYVTNQESKAVNKKYSLRNHCNRKWKKLDYVTPIKFINNTIKMLAQKEV